MLAWWHSTCQYIERDAWGRPAARCCPRHTTLSRHNAAVMAWILCSVSPLMPPFKFSLFRRHSLAWSQIPNSVWKDFAGFCWYGGWRQETTRNHKLWSVMRIQKSSEHIPLFKLNGSYYTPDLHLNRQLVPVPDKLLVLRGLGRRWLASSWVCAGHLVEPAPFPMPFLYHCMSIYVNCSQAKLSHAW